MFAVLDEQHLADRLEALDHVGLLRRLGEGERLADLASREDLSPWTRLCARWVAAQRAVEGADGVPPLTGEELRLCRRTTRLRRMELFGELPGAVLARMVPKLQRVEVEGGEPVFGKGEEGDGMYVVLDGRVRVHDNGRELAVLGADTVFGEFTVLQRQPRTASVTALEPTRLLRFTQEDLHELIREQVAVGRALIRVILRRLRENREISSSGPEEPG